MRWTLPDTLLYAHFNRTFWERIDAMGRVDFMAEVEDLNAILDKSIPYCNTATEARDALQFEATKWNPAFEITYQDCSWITSKTGMRQELRDRYDSDPGNLPQPVGRIPGC